MAFCPNCGAQHPDDAEFCPSCGRAVGAAAVAAGTKRYGGFWRRVLAFFIDALVVGIPLSIVLGIAGVGSGYSSGGSGTSYHASNGGFLIRLVVGWLYFALMESSVRQATLGKMALGMRVTDESGGRLSFSRATGRYFAKYVSAIILGIGFIMAAFTARKRALHDMIASTLVELR